MTALIGAHAPGSPAPINATCSDSPSGRVSFGLIASATPLDREIATEKVIAGGSSRICAELAYTELTIGSASLIHVAVALGAERP
jgi:hypothetical protein